ncbi:MAG: iron-sulfur cluster assembly accessory protein [Proteobacteria bacterium]|nr:iron-sulfur cluster assembly accessory protein [Pseudomonadota bacterium]NCA28324.1 iron-sulfur cluster assembly accessory protein [Pseudomonadota bacterium]
MNFNFSSTGNPIVDYLKVSPEALTQIKNLLSKRSEPCEGIRVGVRTRGCSGLSYTIEYAIKDKNISKYDDVVLCDQNDQKIQIFIDPKVSMFLIGSEMIFKQDQLSSGFDFVNPNEKGRCGCGESFNV